MVLPQPLTVLGVMSGTSLDAIDVAVCRFSRTDEREIEMELLGYGEQPFEPDLRERLLRMIADEAAHLGDLAAIHVRLGTAFGTACRAIAARTGITLDAADLIACHGQTLYHLVQDGATIGTLQIGESAHLAAITGITVVADFRPADVAAGGRGAPLVSLFDALFFGHPHRTRAVQNIGGMANVTLLPAGMELEGARAFDTGPGNALIDHAAYHVSGGRELLDRDGALAARGTPDGEIVDDVLRHPYFAEPPPKTTGRELFGATFAMDLIRRCEERELAGPDVLATVTAITARSIADAYRRFGPTSIDDIILSGGGARNGTLVRMIRELLPGSSVALHDAFGLPAEAKEAVAFALMGFETLHGRPSNVPSCTGARTPAVLGKITPGANYGSLMRRVLASGFGGPGPRRLCLGGQDGSREGEGHTHA